MAIRHLSGPTAQPFLDWRKSMNDEQWVEWGALDDDAWYDRVQADFGLKHAQKWKKLRKGQPTAKRWIPVQSGSSALPIADLPIRPSRLEAALD